MHSSMVGRYPISYFARILYSWVYGKVESSVWLEWHKLRIRDLHILLRNCYQYESNPNILKSENTMVTLLRSTKYGNSSRKCLKSRFVGYLPETERFLLKYQRLITSLYSQNDANYQFTLVYRKLQIHTNL